MRHIVVSGIPGSGKSTLARQLGPPLSMSVLDKDDLLDALFDSLGVGDADSRSRLSRRADEAFLRDAAGLDAAILVSWWRHPRGVDTTGTPTSWLASQAPPVVEIHCVCPPELAAARFVGRRRHPGHLDARRALDTLRRDFEHLATLGPLAYGPVLEISTASEVNLEELIARVRTHLTP